MSKKILIINTVGLSFEGISTVIHNYTASRFTGRFRGFPPPLSQFQADAGQRWADVRSGKTSGGTAPAHRQRDLYWQTIR